MTVFRFSISVLILIAIISLYFAQLDLCWELIIVPNQKCSNAGNSDGFLLHQIHKLTLSSVQFSHSVVSSSFRPHGLQHGRLPRPSPTNSLLKLISIESVMPYNHLILCSPLLLPASVFPSIRVFFKWVSSLHQVAKVLEFQLQHQSFQWIFRTDFF